MHASPPRDPHAVRTLIDAMYAAFNARDLDTGLAFLHRDVDWQNGWEGGRLHGHAALRDYWTRQWAAIDPRVEPVGVTTRPDGRIVVDVRQTVRDLAGTVLDERMVQHVYAMRDGLISRMDIAEPDTPRAG